MQLCDTNNENEIRERRRKPCYFKGKEEPERIQQRKQLQKEEKIDLKKK